MSEKSHKTVPLVRMLADRIQGPYLRRTVEEHHPASSGFGIVRIELLKNVADYIEWKRRGVLG
jgi:hypothetical protein